MTPICRTNDIVPNSGVCALLDGQQVAVFRTDDDRFYAIDNYDPFGKANVLSRGLIGGQGDKLYVASPLHKQRFYLENGECLEDESMSVRSYRVLTENDKVYIGAN